MLHLRWLQPKNMKRSIKMKSKQMMKNSIRIIALLLMCFTLLGAMLLSGGGSGFLSFIDQPSLLLIVIFMCSMLLFSNTFGDYLRGIKIAGGNPEYTTNELKASINALDLSIALVYIAAVIGVLVGTISILNHVEELKEFRLAYSINLLVVFYAFIINLIHYSIRARLRKELIYRG
jgi:type III secretory pathway component EscS